MNAVKRFLYSVNTHLMLPVSSKWFVALGFSAKILLYFSFLISLRVPRKEKYGLYGSITCIAIYYLTL